MIDPFLYIVQETTFKDKAQDELFSKGQSFFKIDFVISTNTERFYHSDPISPIIVIIFI